MKYRCYSCVLPAFIPLRMQAYKLKCDNGIRRVYLRCRETIALPSGLTALFKYQKDDGSDQHKPCDDGDDKISGHHLHNRGFGGWEN